MLPGKKLFSFKTDTGKRYVCIAFTNKVKFKGMMPITDILFDDITAVRKLPSPFKKWLYRQVGKKARAIMYHFTDKKN